MKLSDLHLDDFTDWRSETLSTVLLRQTGVGFSTLLPVRKSERHFRDFRRYGRPHVDDGHVFLGERRPWAPLLHSHVWLFRGQCRRRMRDLGIELDHLGPHDVMMARPRNAPAPEGNIPQGYCRLLGQCDTNSVSVYAEAMMCAPLARFRIPVCGVAIWDFKTKFKLMLDVRRTSLEGAPMGKGRTEPSVGSQPCAAREP